MSLSELKLETTYVDVAGRRIRIQEPANPDEVLSTCLESDEDGLSDPYWGVLWPAAIHTAAMILNRRWAGTQTRTLDIGCGLGLTGIAAMICGHRVTFNDIVPEAVELAVANAKLNELPDAESLVFPWASPIEEKFDLIVASDVLYEVAGHAPLLNMIERMLGTDGEVLIGDMGRGHAISFVENAIADGWEVSVTNEQGRPIPGPVRQQFQTFRIVRQPG